MNGQARLAFLNACQALIGQGRLPEVEVAARKVLVDDPEFVEARFVLAFVLSRQARWEEAVAELERVLRAEPNRAEALFSLAAAQRMLGRLAEAEQALKRCVAIQPGNAQVLSELAQIQSARGEVSEAVATLARAVFANPHSAALRHLQGKAFAAQDRVAESRDAFREAIWLDPKDVNSVVGLVQQLVRLSRFDEALEAIQNGLRHSPDAVSLLVLLGGALSRRGELNEAEEAYRRAAEIDPSAVQSYAAWLQEQGRFDESGERLGESIRRGPSQGISYYRLTEIRRFELDGRPLLDRAEQALQATNLPAIQRMYLLFALGKMYEHGHRFEDAMRSFDLANASAFEIYNSGRPFDHRKEKETNDRRIARFDQGWLRQDHRGDAGDTPILIVGMIRSGTTLLDQIVSSHREVASAGELRFWITEADRQVRGENRGPRTIAKEYLQLLQEAGGKARHETDKMPLNYAYLGLIHSVLPNAKILHIRRNPLDTCLSIYSTHLGLGPRFAYDKGNIVFNYREYLRLLEHWRTALPEGTMFELDYEQLVSDPEPVTRKAIEFCGLDWDPECLSHQRSASAIHTPSRWQARQPMYRTSVDKWKAYEPYLGEFAALIDTMAEPG